MQIPGTKPFGFPQDVKFSSQNVRIWMAKEYPGMFKTYSPVSATSDIVMIGSLLTYIGGFITGHNTLKKWSGWVGLASIIPSMLCNFTNGVFRGTWDQLTGKPLRGNYLTANNDKKEQFLNKITTLYENNYWREGNDVSGELQKVFASDPENKKVLLQKLDIATIRLIDKDLKELYQFAYRENYESNDPEVQKARNQYYAQKNAICSIIRIVSTLDDKDFALPLTNIAKACELTFSFDAAIALIEMENKFDDSRALKHLIELIQSDEYSSTYITRTLHSRSYQTYIKQIFADDSTTESSQEIRKKLIQGLLRNKKLLASVEMHDLILDIAKSTTQEELKFSLILQMQEGYPLNADLFDQLIEIFHASGDLQKRKVNYDAMYEAHEQGMRDK